LPKGRAARRLIGKEGGTCGEGSYEQETSSLVYQPGFSNDPGKGGRLGDNRGERGKKSISGLVKSWLKSEEESCH